MRVNQQFNSVPSNEIRRFIESAKRLNHLDITVPTIHYHYTSVASALLILESAKFKLSHPDSFNDPFDLDNSIIDFRCDVETLVEYLKKMEAAFPNYKKPSNDNESYFIDKDTVNIFKGIFKEYRDNFGVGCFSGVYNNTLMWSHYAKSHSGVCIGFDYKTFISECFVYPVKYVDSLITCRFFDFDIQPLFYVSYLKSNIWDYEQEIRVTHFKSDNYLNKCVPFEREKVLKVYFGLKTKPEDKEKLLIGLKDGNYSNVEVYEMIRNPENYGFLEPERLKM